MRQDKLIQSHQSLSHDIKRLGQEICDKKICQRYYADNPYVVLGIAAAAGYVVAGGLFSPFTRRLVRIGMKGLFFPVALSKVTDFVPK